MTTIKSAIERLRSAIGLATYDNESALATLLEAMRVDGRDSAVSTWATWYGGERVKVSVVVTRGGEG